MKLYEPTDDPIVMLDRMRDLTLLERVVAKGDYSRFIGDADKLPADAPCGGNQFCAIGSLWFAAGIWKRDPHQWGEYHGFAVTLTDVTESSRILQFHKNPGLRLAYDSLNRAGEEWAERHGYERHDGFVAGFENMAEGLFEGYSETESDFFTRSMHDPDAKRHPLITDEDFIEIVGRARELAAEAVAAT